MNRLLNMVAVLSPALWVGLPVFGATALRVEPDGVRVMTFNLEDVRTADLLDPTQPRLRRMAEIIQRIRPNILLLNEIAYDQPGGPDVPENAQPGQNGRRFVENFLSKPQGPGLEPMDFSVFQRPSNTGRASGFDLNRDGRTVTSFPPPTASLSDGSPGPQTADGRAYGNDCWGFGTFPGQYGMALLVDPRLEIVEADSRTFRLLPWRYLPEHLMPQAPATGPQAEPEVEAAVEQAEDAPDDDQAPPPDNGWYEGEAGELFRLASKSFWDVPVRLPNGEVLHVLCSHPTPPAFDGPEGRNKRRNHDEIRLIADYIDGAAYLVDDESRAGGLGPRDAFVVLGDLNADPDEGSSMYNPIQRLLLDSPRVLNYPAPTSPRHIDGLDTDDTAMFRLRVDYVLPSSRLQVLRAGLWRGIEGDVRPMPSDHFPVWADLVVPDGKRQEP